MYEIIALQGKYANQSYRFIQQIHTFTLAAA